jgi:hypothetical protein
VTARVDSSGEGEDEIVEPGTGIMETWLAVVEGEGEGEGVDESSVFVELWMGTGMMDA